LLTISENEKLRIITHNQENIARNVNPVTAKIEVKSGMHSPVHEKKKPSGRKYLLTEGNDDGENKQINNILNDFFYIQK
jgi:hypothetical protein